MLTWHKNDCYKLKRTFKKNKSIKVNLYYYNNIVCFKVISLVYSMHHSFKM